MCSIFIYLFITGLFYFQNFFLTVYFLSNLYYLIKNCFDGDEISVILATYDSKKILSSFSI